jgi:hypothetical protein
MGFLHPSGQSELMSEIPAEIDDLHPFVGSGESIQDFHGLVLTAVVDKNDLPLMRQLSQTRFYPFE